jgi:hypothetical protein
MQFWLYLYKITRTLILSLLAMSLAAGIKIRIFYKDTLYVYASGVARVYQVGKGPS